MPPGMMPSAMIAATQLPALSLEGKPIKTARALVGLGKMRTVTSVTTPRRPSEPHDLAVDGHELDAQHVVGGETVFEAMHAAGVLGDVATDGTGDLARRIGRVVEAGMLDGEGHAQVGDARLRHDAAVGEIDLEYPIELPHAED